MTYLYRDLVGRHEQNWLRWLDRFRGVPKRVALEIGTYEGTSAMWFCEHILTHPSSQLITVDPYRQHQSREAVMRERTKELRLAGKLLPVKMPSREYLQKCSRRLVFDWAYIDGDHSERAVRSDFILALRHVRPGGVIICDDYGNPRQKGVRAALDPILASLQYPVERTPQRQVAVWV